MTVKEQYDRYLDDLHEDGLLDLSAYQGSKILEEIDPIAYRVGMADFVPDCEECGAPIESASEDDDAICQDCKDDEEGEDDDIA